MPRFFINSNQIFNDKITISEDDSKHIMKVLRNNIGDNITVSGDNLLEYFCKISEYDKKNVILDILETKENISEPKTKITLFQALPKQGKMDLIIQKCVELGVYEIITFESDYTIGKSNEKSEKKALRWQKISESAAKQSGRGIIPKIFEPISFENLLDKIKLFDKIFVAYEKEDTLSLKSIEKKEYGNICIIVGSEGGFSPLEIEKIIENGGESISLGKRILRTETAGFVMLTILLHELEN